MLPRHQSSNLNRQVSEEFVIKSIVVPVDFSGFSEQALRYAAAFAERFDAELTLVHVVHRVSGLYVVEPNLEVTEKLEAETHARAERKLGELASQIAKPLLRINREVRAGNAVEEIVEAARARNADLIITGTHGRTALKHVFLGSVAEGTIRYAPCPVLVVRGEGPNQLPTPFQLNTLLVAVDFSKTSDLALAYAERIAEATGGNLTLMHVAPIHYPISEYGALECPQVDAELLVSAERQTREIAEIESDKGFRTAPVVKQGNAGVEIVAAAKDTRPGLIVLGTRGLTGLRHVLLGSTAEYVARHADCPVLIVRPRATEPERIADMEADAEVDRINPSVVENIARTHPFLDGMSPSTRTLLLNGAAIAEFQPGEIIFREGDYADKFYLIHEGRIALECHSPGRDITVQTLKSGDVLGWSWLFPPFSWHFQARAMERTTALKLNAAQILIASEDDDQLGHQLMKRVAQLLIHRLQETQKRLVQECSEPATAGA